MTSTPKPRLGQAPTKLGRDEFHLQFQRSHRDAAFDEVQDALASVEEVAWDNYTKGHKVLLTEKAGPGFADPDYALSVEWKATRDRLLAAQAKQEDPASPSRVLLICGSARNDGRCASEMSKTFRMSEWARERLEADGIEVDLLDLSLLTSSYDLHIQHCKACVVRQPAALRRVLATQQTAPPQAPILAPGAS